MTVASDPSTARTAEAVEADVVLIVVTYNSAAIIGRFLRAIPAALADVPSAHVVVVDNASTDDTPDVVRAAAPWVTIIEAGVNGGYGAGVNLGLRYARARRGVYILNPDAIPSPGSIAALTAALDRPGNVGVTVPTMLDGAGHVQCSLRREPTLRRALGQAVLGGTFAARFASLGERVVDPGVYVDGGTADWATGAALMVSRQVIDDVGLWAEDFFLYSEETEYALRVRDAGYRLEYVPAAVVTHAGGEQSRSPWLWSLHVVNRVRLYRRRHGRVSTAAYWAVAVLNEGVRTLRGGSTHRAALRALISGHPALSPDSPNGS